MWRRLSPAFSLILLAPLIAEYLLGSLTFSQLAFFPIMALMYGGGALLVRELVRRSGRGWSTILALGLAYGVIEEGLATQSLFNPHYLGLRLLDHGFIPSLGIGGPWTAYVIVLHVVWSIAVPIGFVEALFPDRRTKPWLGNPGFVICGIGYLLGVALITFGTWKKEQFSASPAQLTVTAGLALLIIVAAFAFFRRARTPPASDGSVSKCRPYALGLLAFAAGSVFHLISQFGSGYLSPVVMVLLTLALPAIVIRAVRLAEKSGPWTAAQTDALILGGLLAYCWLGFFLTARLHGVQSLPGQFFPCIIVLALVYGRFVRQRNGLDLAREK